MTAMSKAPRRPLAGTTVGIPPRQIDFRFPEAAGRYPYDNNTTASMLLAVFSGIFPPGERFFVESVRHFRDAVQDDTLRAQVSGFIGQEALHGREHERLNDYLAERGIDTRVPELGVKAGLWLLARLPKRQQLACTTLMEHFTASLAEQLLENEQFCSRFDAEMLKIWQWHALEELEHKNVTFDVLELVGNDYRERALAAPLVVATILPGIFLSWTWLVAREGGLTNTRDVRKGLGQLFGRGGLITATLRHMPVFFKRDFHPRKRDTRALEQRWRERLFGEQGQLKEEWRNSEVTTV